MCSARPSFAPSVCAIVSVTSAGSRSAASPTQKTPAVNVGHQLGGRLDRQPRLARAARAGERDEPRAVREAAHELDALALAGRRRRRPAAEGSCSRSSSAAGSARCPSWKSATGASKSLSRCSPSSVNVAVDERPRRRRDDDLAAVARRRRSGRRGATPGRRSPRRSDAARPCADPSAPGPGRRRAPPVPRAPPPPPRPDSANA